MRQCRSEYFDYFFPVHQPDLRSPAAIQIRALNYDETMEYLLAFKKSITDVMDIRYMDVYLSHLAVLNRFYYALGMMLAERKDGPGAGLVWRLAN